jgi:hypothetical protein
MAVKAGLGRQYKDTLNRTIEPCTNEVTSGVNVERKLLHLHGAAGTGESAAAEILGRSRAAGLNR